MSSYRALSRWACPILFACSAATAACSSSSDDTPANVAGAANGGSPGATAGASNAAGAAVAGAANPGTGGAPGQAGAGASGASAQAGAASGGTSNGGTAGGNAAGASAGGVSGSAGSATAGASGSGGASTGAFTLTSPGWTAMPNCMVDTRATSCPVFPKENIGTSIGGGNKSPELDWTAGPSGTQSYAIVLQDLTVVQSGKPFVHWAMWNIPGTTRMLPAGLETTAMPSVPAGSSQKSFQGTGFQGSGKCGNLYEFVLYALPTAMYTGGSGTQTAVRDGLAATNAPTATLRARSGAPGCTE